MIWFAVMLLLSWQQASPQLESQVKAAFIYNFAQYTEWPKNGPENGRHFNFCVAGNGVTEALENIVRGETVNGKTAVVRPLAETDNPQHCQVLFISETQTQHKQADVLN